MARELTRRHIRVRDHGRCVRDVVIDFITVADDATFVDDAIIVFFDVIIVVDAITIYNSIVALDAIAVEAVVIRTAFVAITVIDVRTVVYVIIARVAVDVSVVKRLVVESFTIVAVKKRSSSHPQCH